MRNMNDEWMRAAEQGDEARIKALLINPKRDALDKDTGGMTALMPAAWEGHTSCVKLLLPVSEALACSVWHKTAADLATHNGYHKWGGLMDAYALSGTERAFLIQLRSVLIRGIWVYCAYDGECG